jgi:hypothetical protein
MLAHDARLTELSSRLAEAVRIRRDACPSDGHERQAEQIPVLVSQYMAYLDGRLGEVALDRYAQAHDGSVWYLGEDVFDYRNGTIALTEGTWLAGRDGPGAMIMPAKPKVGDVYRTENAPGIVFEEVTVKSVSETVQGPSGPVSGAMIASELHSDGTSEDKIFAPGYGEFRTAGGGDLEALAEAVPADAEQGPMPTELASMAAMAGGVLEAARLNEWKAASVSAGSLDALSTAVADHSAPRAEQDSLDLSQSVLDLRLRYRPAAEIDARLAALRSAADARNLHAAADQAARLGARLRAIVDG